MDICISLEIMTLPANMSQDFQYKKNCVESTIIMPFLIKYYMELYIYIFVNPLKLYSNTKR